MLFGSMDYILIPDLMGNNLTIRKLAEDIKVSTSHFMTWIFAYKINLLLKTTSWHDSMVVYLGIMKLSLSGIYHQKYRSSLSIIKAYLPSSSSIAHFE